MTDDDIAFLRRAVALAQRAIESGNPPFGSLLVGPAGAVLIEEHNTAVTDDDITAHPELKLARWAARELDPDTASRTTMYTSTQPCGMCTGGIERSGLGRVVFAVSVEQYATLVPSERHHAVPLDGPAILDEARIPIEAYYPR